MTTTEKNKKEPECINIRSPRTATETKKEKYKVLNNVKNVAIGIIVASEMLVNDWIEVENKLGQIATAMMFALLIAIILHCTDEFIDEW